MPELKLDLCVQSTSHLMEILTSLKENIRVLEVYLQSGLQDTENSLDFSRPSSSPGYSEINKSLYSQFGRKTTSFATGSSGNEKSHQSYLCTCTSKTRFNDTKTRTTLVTTSTSYEKDGKHTETNGHCVKKGKRGTVWPRLNRSASLRRETAIERSQGCSSNNHHHSYSFHSPSTNGKFN